MMRRKFIRSVSMAGGALLAPASLTVHCATLPDSKTSDVVIARDDNVLNQKFIVDTERLQKLLDRGIMQLFGCDTPYEAWQRVVKPGEVIGLKVNCLSGRGTTHPELVSAICERLREAGIRSENIVIWDRFNSDLEEGGFKINYNTRGVQVMGNEILGFESDFAISGAAASLVCKTLTRLCDGVINLPVLKDHGIAGITLAMKNLFGSIHNPNKYHLNVGDPFIPDVYSFKPIREKVRLHICDALIAQYDGGPSYMPHWSWAHNSLLFSKDPVALDYTGWQIIEAKRKEKGKKPLRAVGREPKYIFTAGNASHKLGSCDPNFINVKHI